MVDQPSELRKKLRKTIGVYFDDCPHINSQLKEEAIDKLLALISTSQREALEDLKSELRDYHDKYPDVDYQDIIGYITGFQKRPALTDSKYHRQGGVI